MLAINQLKTTLAEVMIGQKRVRTKENPPELSELEPNGSTKQIQIVKSCKLLLIIIQENLTWGKHLETGEEAHLPETRKKLGKLKHLRRTMLIKSRKLLK